MSQINLTGDQYINFIKMHYINSNIVDQIKSVRLIEGDFLFI